jgi:phosphate-selective porin OprO/OprP
MYATKVCRRDYKKGKRVSKRGRSGSLGLFLVVLVVFLATIGAGAIHARAQSTETMDSIWRFAEWYDSPDSFGVQNVSFSGRFQYEYATVDGDHASHTEWNVRRMRLGVKTEFLEQLTFHAEAEFNPQETDPFYMRLTDFYLEWSPDERFALTFGKQGVPFTIDGSTSSKELLTIDRSNLSNNMWFTQEYMPGASVSGEKSSWHYRLGAYSGGSADREFGEFDAGWFTLTSIGYDFAGKLGTDEAVLTLSYVYQDPDAGNTFTRSLQHVGSVNFKLETGLGGVRADFTAASGFAGQSDLWGVMTMPFLNVTERFQVVGRHTYISSDDENGVRLARYESELVSGRGDRYTEWYVGANYYFYGHKLKLQSGVSFADMEDRANDGGEYSGVAATAGLRVSW